MKPILIFKFPFSSTFGGGEHHTLEVFSDVARRGVPFYFVGSCRVLLKEFRQRHWPTRTWWAGKEPVTPLAIALFPFTSVIALPVLLVLLIFYRVRMGTRVLYCLSFTEKVLLTPWARLIGMRVLWVEHVEPGRWLRQNPLRIFYVLWARIATIVTVSEHVGAQFAELRIPKSRITVVYPGVAIPEEDAFRRRTFHWSKRFNLGTVARLEPEKGVGILLQAFQRVLTVVPFARLIIVGDGSDRKRLEWLARNLAIERSVQFVGFQKDAAQWIRSFDCFVLPSVKREAFGIVLLEAMAAMSPIVASNLGGIPEVIRNNKDGILVEPNDAEMLTGAILYLYNHPDVALQLAHTGYERLVEHFSRERMLESFAELLS